MMTSLSLSPLSPIAVPDAPRAQLLVLHGGTQHSTRPVDGRSLAWQRGRILARSLASGLEPEQVGISLVHYRVKGWNASGTAEPSPVSDARQALEAVPGDSDVPIVLVGHSMGARTAVAVADHPRVAGVVALAGWLPADEPIDPLRGKILRVGHGRRDRITSFRAASIFVERASAISDAKFTDMGSRGHYLIRGIGGWNDFAVDAVTQVLRGH